MKRKILFSILALVMLALLVGCSNQPYNYDLSKYIKFSNDYKSIALDMETIQANVDKAIEDIKNEQSATEEITEDRGAAEGESVSITFTGKMLDDNSSPEGINSDTETELVLGSDTMIDGFEDGLVGVKKGETKTLHLTFPADYHNTELAGRAVDFDVTVHKISKIIPGEFTDAVANEISGGQYPTVAEYTDYILKEEKLSAVQTALFGIASFNEYPTKEIKKEYDQYVNNYKMMALNNGQSFEAYVQANQNLDLDSFLYTVAQQAEDSVRQRMTVYYVLQQEGKTVTNDVFEELAAELFGASYEAFESYYGAEYMNEVVAVRYACQLILDQIG